MPTLQECIAQYNSNQKNEFGQLSNLSSKSQDAKERRDILIEIQQKYGNSPFEFQDIKDIILKHRPKYKAKPHNCFQFVQMLLKSKLLYKIQFQNGNSMYKIVYIPDEGTSRLTLDEKREIQARYNQIDLEVKSNHLAISKSREEKYKDIAYTTHTEQKHLPIEEKHIFEAPKKEQSFKSVEDILLPVGMVDISTKKEANKRYDLRGDDTLSLSIKLSKGENEVFTFSVKDKTRIELLQKVLSILEATK